MASKMLGEHSTMERHVTLLYQEYDSPLVNTVQIQSLHSFSDLLLIVRKKKGKSKSSGNGGRSLSSWPASLHSSFKTVRVTK